METHSVSSPDELAFYSLLEPLVEQSNATLAKALAAESVLSGACLISSHAAYLCKKLSAVAAGCVAEELRRQRFATIKTSLKDLERAPTYESFVEATLGTEQGRRALYERYPVLEGVLGQIASATTEATRLLIERFDRDCTAIAASFFKPGTLAAIEFGLSDPHHGHQTVVLLTFDEQQKLVYKPRSAELDREFQNLAAWLNRRLEQSLGSPAFRTAEVVSCQTHSWHECILPQPTTDIALFSRRSGGLAALLYFLCGTDFHAGNVIVQGNTPVPIDMECLFSHTDPLVQQQETLPVDYWPVAFSALSTGYLPHWTSASSEKLLAVSAGVPIATDRPDVLPRRRWTGCGTNSFAAAWDTRPMERERNVPHDIAGKRMFLDVSSFGDGFVETYALLQDNRDEFGRRLEPFDGLSSRALLRNTYSYHHLLDRLAEPVSFRSKDHFEKRLRLLHANTFPHSSPYLTALEFEGLSAFDIPHFVAPVRGITLQPGSLAICSVAPLEQVRQRMSLACREDAGRQRQLCRVAIVMAEEPVLRRPTSLQAAANAIGEAIAGQAIAGTSGLQWMHVARTPGRQATHYASCSYDLYNGSAGIALFFANLYAVSRSFPWKQRATDTLRFADGAARLIRPSVSAYEGTFSVCYALTECARLLEEPAWLDEALRLVDRFAAHIGVLDAPRSSDLIAGEPGAILTLLHLHAATSEARLLELAQTLAERVVSAPIARPGLGHGAGGQALALACLGGSTRSESLLRSAEELLAAERIHWQRFSGSRSDPLQLGYPSGWCSGAPGLGLGRLALLQTPLRHRVGDSLLNDIEDAIVSTQFGLGQPSDHLCCGETSRILFLAQAARQLDRPELEVEAKNAFGALLDRSSQQGHWFLQHGPERESFPGLMGGVAGIGLTALLLAEPKGLSMPLLLR
jgi:type 2 lantibiotic biosynthesis protein LanM